jgi:hypothetical protein
MQTLTCNSDTTTRGTSTYMQDWVDPEIVGDDRSLAGINELHTGTDTGTNTDTHTYTHTDPIPWWPRAKAQLRGVPHTTGIYNVPFCLIVWRI